MKAIDIKQYFDDYKMLDCKRDELNKTLTAFKTGFNDAMREDMLASITHLAIQIGIIQGRLEMTKINKEEL